MKKILFPLVCLSAISLNQQLNAQLSFSPAVNYMPGNYPFSISSADFNGDGFSDIATANYGPNEVAVFIANGSGGFSAAVNYGVGTNPDGIMAADVNEDGKPDLVVTNSGSNSVSILLGNGSGSFAAAVNYATGPGPQSSVARDFNGDGNLDLAVANRNSATLSLLLGDGTGAFAAPVSFGTGASPAEIISADFNGDGKADVATVNNSSSDISVLLGNGAGGFSTAVSYTGGSSSFALHAADVNMDGKTDILVANPGSDNVSVLLGDGLGAFAAAVNYPTGAASVPYSVKAADFNSDGIPDLVTANNNSNDVSVLLGNGDGTFAAAINYGVGQAPTSITASDFNGDNRIDIAVANSYGNTISVLTNLSSGPGSALNFDGMDDNISIGTSINAILDPLNTITVEALVNPSTISGLGVIIGNYSNGNSDMQFLLRRDGDQYAFWVSDGTGFNVANSGLGTVLINTWQHVAGVWDGSEIKIYIDGVLKATTTGVTGSSLESVSNPVIIGYNYRNENFTGSIDEVRLWSSARSQCEINTYKGCEIPGASEGLIANYHFNQGIFMANNSTITNLTDVSGNGYTGPLSGFALTGSASNWVAPSTTLNGYTTSLAPLVIGAMVTNSVICEGNSTVLTGTGADMYSWTTGVINGSSFTPTVTGTYTVTGTSLSTGCTNTAAATVSVNPKPSMTVNSGTVCSGSLFVISPTGADNYTYSSGSDNVNPTSDATYTVTGMDANGCENTVYSSVTVNPLPTVTVNSGTVCAGQAFTLTPGGAITYTFSDGSNMYIPTVGASYSVTGHGVTGMGANGCSGYAYAYITAYDPPVISATTNNTLLCTGETATLSVTGATSYTWSTTETSADIAVAPTTQTTYTVEGTDANGCSNATTIMQDVSLCTGIAVLSITDASVRVYPNPTTGLFTVYLTSVSNVSIANALGEVVLSGTMDAGMHNLSIQDQPTGIYFVKTMQDNKQYVIKIIKE